MLVNINDIELTDEIVEKATDTHYNRKVDQQRKINSPKYLIIDFRHADAEKFKATKHQMMQLIDLHINNREILGMCYKAIETKNEEYLWNQLVDDRIISNDFYLKNTYDENLDILFKMKHDIKYNV